MREAVITAMPQLGVSDPHTPLWVAVSGGMDSMVLLHVLHHAGYPVQVIHVDHGLRGAESDADREMVRAYCASLQVPVTVQRVNVMEHVERCGASVQMAARTLRYEVFHRMVMNGPPLLAMAHHADDAVETFLMHLMQGMGLRGWAGIPARTGAFIRPLLKVPRDRIAEYAKDHAVLYREDASNRDPAYLRSRVRHELIPLLDTFRDGSRRTVQRNVVLARELSALANASLDAALEGLGPDADGNLHIPQELILSSPAPLLFLHRLLGAAAFHPDRLDDILLALRNKRVGARFDHGAMHVLVDREQLIIHRPQEPSPTWTITGPDRIPDGLPMTITPCSLADVDHGQGPLVAWMDARGLQWPLVVRPWQHGDRIRPFAGNGSSLISDLLIDRKVPGHRKPHCHVLTSGGIIAWLCGYRLAEGFQLRDDTAEVLRFQWSGWPAPDR